MSAFTIATYRDDDAAGVTALRQASYGEAAVDDESFRWRHWGFGVPNGMQVAKIGSEIVGVQPVEVYPFVWRGENLAGAVLTGVMVHPAHRRQGIFSALIEAAEQWAWRQGAHFVTTMPNDRSFPGFLKRGYVDPGSRSLMVRPLALGDFAARKLRLPGLRSAGDGITAVLTALPPALVGRVRAVDVTKVQRFSDDVAPAVEAVCKRSLRLIQARSRAWLRWRYESAPGHPYRVFEGRCGDEVVGYAVTRREHRAGMNVGYLVDIIGETWGDVTMLAHGAARALRAEGCHAALAVVTSAPLRAALAAAAFAPVPARWAPKRFHTVYRLHPAREGALAGLRRIGTWYQTLGDWDTI